MLNVLSALLNVAYTVLIATMVFTGAIGLVRPMNDGTSEVARVVVDPAADQVVRIETAPAVFVQTGEVRKSAIKAHVEGMAAHYRQETDEGATTSQ